MMMMGFLMLVVGAVFAYIYSTKFKNPQIQDAITEKNKLAALKAKELRELSQGKELIIENLGPGAVIQLQGVGLTSQNLDVQIEAKHLIKDGSDHYYELEGSSGAGKVFISLEDDNEIYATLKSPKLAELGLKGSDLDQLDVDKGKSITFDGDTYNLENIGVKTYCKNSNELESENFDEWSFEGSDSEQYLNIERWGRGGVEVSYSVPIKPSQIVIYSVV